MGQTEIKLAKKLAEAKKKRVREEGIANLKAKLKQERSAGFKARYGGLMAGIQKGASSLKAVAKDASKQQKKKKDPFKDFNRLF